MPRISEKFHHRTGDLKSQTSEEPPDRPKNYTGIRGFWPWFAAMFALVVLVGGSILYLTDSSPTIDDEPPSVQEPAAGDEALADSAPQEPPEPQPPAAEAGQTTSVLLGSFVVDSFGFHGMEEAYAEATEVGERDAGQVGKVLTAVDAVVWPDELADAVEALRDDLSGLIAALEAGDLERARDGLAAVHGSQHDFSNGVYAWLRGDAVESHGTGEPAPGGEATAVIEIEMTEFAFAPDTIDLEAGVPVTLRFTNTGKLLHEAMIGDAHMQEEWASAQDAHDPTDGHHGDLMAVTVEPGETRDLEVVIGEPGTWYMACHIVGHYEQGQKATINVT